MTFDARTGELTFNSDVYRGHDGSNDADDDGDGSTWELRLKPGVKLDFEALPGPVNASGAKTIRLTLTVTDESGDGLSTQTTAAAQIHPWTP